MSEFTKGSWKARSNGAISLSEGKWYIPCGMSEPTELEANARLIAAAPDMYHMIAYLLGYVREWEAISSGTIYKAKVHSDIQKAEALLKRIDGKEKK